ncbi:hypothetical protein HX049_07990 [Myroides odoratimimus]|uniref:phage tail tube protein n=1 Tax=Myroides odoratimimus TaxID=76832 RepID=UPI002577F1FE|nr:phage tail tube protein [Myroides odoratimimus]MDM1397114.1 hypothetical protein [Myroides odoratimimus]
MAKGKIYQGRNVRLRLGGKTIFHATSAKISVNADLEEIATKDTKGKQNVFSGYSWSISAESLVADKPEQSTQLDADDMLEYLTNGQEIKVDFTTAEVGDFIWSGSALISQWDVDASVSGAVKGSFGFAGQGDLERGKVEA